MTTETPQEYLAKSPLTARLKAMGVTDDQLEAMRLLGNKRGRPFDQWSFTCIPGTSAEVMSLTKAYCALKWLTLENPPWSRDKDDAWRLVSDTLVAPVHALGLKYKEAQRSRAQRPRVQIGDVGLTMKELIARFATKPENQNLTVPDLWPRFFAELDSCGVCPTEGECSYEYDYGDGRKSITYGHFANVISRCRRQRQSA
jgi:hypothetical protein